MLNLLIYPPFADPTQPYISLPVLKGYLNAQGQDAKIIDLNILSVYYFFTLKFKKNLNNKIKKNLKN